MTAWKVSRYGVISSPYFPVLGLITGKYGPEIIPYLDTFHGVSTRVTWYDNQPMKLSWYDLFMIWLFLFC